MSWNMTANLNPEFVRGMRTGLPQRRAVFVAALTVAILAIGGWLLWTANAPSHYYSDHVTWTERLATQQKEFGRQAFGILTVTLFGLLFILAPTMAGLSFIQERLRGTAIFQQMSLLSPLQLAAGKFFGSGLLAYFVAAMLVVPAAFAAAIGHVHADMAVRLYLFLFVGGLCMQAIGLAVSAALAAPNERQLRGGLLVGPLVGLGGAVTALALSQYFTYDHNSLSYQEYYYRYYNWHFYGVEVPAYTIILGVLAFAGVCAFVGAVGRIKSWQLIPTRPHAAWLFIAAAEAILVGLLWGRHLEDELPNSRLVLYLALNWIALAALCGATALRRGRLREWWSAERDAVAVFQRGEIKNTVKTFLVALGISLAGLTALWASYHFGPDGRYGQLDPLPLVAVAACFAASMLGMAAFVQFAAMHRFRVGGWAGVALMCIFYFFMGVAGAIFDDKNNSAALVNPLVYAEATTKGDFYMDSYYRSTTNDYVGSEYRTIVLAEPVYEVNTNPGYDLNSARARGLLVQGLLALCCFGLAYVKWSSVRTEMLSTGPEAV
jgi:hypothetical protein